MLLSFYRKMTFKGGEKTEKRGKNQNVGLLFRLQRGNNDGTNFLLIGFGLFKCLALFSQECVWSESDTNVLQKYQINQMK